MGYVTSLLKVADLNPALIMNNVIKLPKYQMGNCE